MPNYIWIQNVVFPIIGMGLIGLLGIGIYRIVSKIIDRKPTSSMTGSGDVNALRAELDAIRAEHAIGIAELHDRLDFTEQLLTRATNTGPAPKRKLTPAKSVFP